MSYYIRRDHEKGSLFLKSVTAGNRAGEWTQSLAEAQGFQNGQIATQLAKTLDRPTNLDFHVVSYDGVIVNIIPAWNNS